MNCSHARRLFGAYWDDEITQAEREWLEGHFTTCARCHTAYEEQAKTLEALSRLPRVEAAPDLAERVLARARRAQTAADRFPVGSLVWVPATAAAVAVLLIAGTVVGPWLATNSRGARPSQTQVASTVREPELIAKSPVQQTPAPESSRNAFRSSARSGTEAALASVPDSLFDHSEDVDFILDPVTIRRGRPAVARPMPAVQGQQATISF
jgi:putative zinc finger protein